MVSFVSRTRLRGCSAEQGDENSQYYLSYQFRDGLGVKQDWVEAYFWMGVVVANHKDSRDKYYLERDEIGKELTPEQLESVKKRIANWRSSVTTQKQKDLFNLAAAVCDENDHLCKVQVCGDLVDFHCAGNDGATPIINKRTNEIVSECSFWGHGHCDQPTEWTCGIPFGFH